MSPQRAEAPALAVVVLSHGPRATLCDAVRSLLRQDGEAEIVVVHSGAGDVRRQLGAAGLDVRVIQCDERLLPGAARNLGIAETHLVPALLANIEPLADGWIAYDDRNGDGVFSDEVHRRAMLLNAARDAGAKWALAVDPDERFESSIAAAMPLLTGNASAGCYTFALREMYSENSYRVDGVWGHKRQARLLNLSRGVLTPSGHLHLSWSSFVPTPNLMHTDFNLYHLKMIVPERRKARAALYSALDPEHRMQKIGYDYLADETGAEFEAIPAGREFTPAHVEDGGLWMPQLAEAR